MPLLTFTSYAAPSLPHAMNIQHQALVLTLFIFSLLHRGLPYEDPRAQLCDDTTFYLPNSTFSTNLNLALNTLRNTTATTGFNDTTASPVTALALCRASLSPSDCQTCIDAAVSGIRHACPNQTVGQVWYTYCMLRYSHRNFIGQPEDNIGFMLYDVRAAPDEKYYDQRVNILMQKLSSNAGNSAKMAAVGKISMLENKTVYGYVDCTRDISGIDCTRCLLDATAAIPSCCSGKWAGWIATPTCNIQFNMDPVHEDWLNAPEIYLDTSPAPAPPATEKGGFENGKRGRFIGTMVGVAAAVLVIMILSVLYRKIMTRKKSILTNETEQAMKEDLGARSLCYDFNVLSAATDSFSSENRLGGGAFGSVYWGRLPDGEIVAVKKLRAGSVQGKEEFSNEVRLLLKVKHKNLVDLHGYCVQGEDLMLIYEYLPNRSLDYFLFDKSKRAMLDWTKRFNIISSIARGLLYLHEDSQLKIIHRDIKASNILLDEEMNPKISDFGLARLFDDEQSSQRTRRIAGTFGYMAPEYAVRGVVSTNSDVFSLGVLILEIISGRKVYNPQLDEESQELLCVTRRLEKEGRLIELVDENIGSFPEEDALKCIRIGLLCCQERAQNRPTMSTVVFMLSSDSVTIPAAGRLGYQGSRDNTNVSFHGNGTPSNLENEDPSQNTITISLCDGR